MPKKVIAVFGATGAQGGGVVRSILAEPDSEFAVRAITRKPESDRARAVGALGAEVVRADLDDLDTVRQALRGAYGVFCVTNFWEHFSPEREREQARNVAEAAAGEGIQHAIWSTLEDTRKWVPLSDDRMPTLMGRYKVPHFDGKAEGDAEFTSRGVPTTFLVVAFYWDNFINFGLGPKADTDGTLALTMPMGDAKLAGIASADVGGCVHGILRRRDHYVGRTVGIASDHLTIAQIASEMSSALGREVRYHDVPAEVFRSFGFPGAEDVGNMFQFYRDFGVDVLAARSVDETRRLNPRLQRFREWLAEHKARIPLE